MRRIERDAGQLIGASLPHCGQDIGIGRIDRLLVGGENGPLCKIVMPPSSQPPASALASAPVESQRWPLPKGRSYR